LPHALADSRAAAPATARLAHEEGVCSLAWSPDGRLLASGGNGGDVLLWRRNGTTLHSPAALAGHAGSVRALAWSPDGRRLLSGAEDRRVVVWSVEDARSIVRHVRHEDYVNGLGSGRLLVRLGRPRRPARRLRRAHPLAPRRAREPPRELHEPRLRPERPLARGLGTDVRDHRLENLRLAPSPPARSGSGGRLDGRLDGRRAAGLGRRGRRPSRLGRRGQALHAGDRRPLGHDRPCCACRALADRRDARPRRETRGVVARGRDAPRRARRRIPGLGGVPRRPSRRRPRRDPGLARPVGPRPAARVGTRPARADRHGSAPAGSRRDEGRRASAQAGSTLRHFGSRTKTQRSSSQGRRRSSFGPTPSTAWSGSSSPSGRTSRSAASRTRCSAGTSIPAPTSTASSSRRPSPTA